MTATVGVCGGPECARELVAPARGRTPSYCSGRCRTAAHRARQLPAPMREAARWVRWHWQVRAGKRTKRPITVRGAAASVTRPQTWATLDAVRASTRGDGIGFVLGDGIGCIDLDHVIVDGQLVPWAQAILDRTPDTYIEISPSGTGLHIFGFLAEAPGRGQHGADGIEFYSQGRYITVTEQRWTRCSSTLADISALVASL